MNRGVKGLSDARLSMSGDARLFTSSLHHSLPSMLQVGPIAVWGLPVSHGVTSWKLCSSCRCRCRGLYSSRFRSRDSFHNSVVCNPVIKLLSLLVITIQAKYFICSLQRYSIWTRCLGRCRRRHCNQVFSYGV